MEWIAMGTGCSVAGKNKSEIALRFNIYNSELVSLRSVVVWLSLSDLKICLALCPKVTLA
jgi:hypothetical protein